MTGTEGCLICHLNACCVGQSCRSICGADCPQWVVSRRWASVPWEAGFGQKRPFQSKTKTNPGACPGSDFH